MAGAKGGEVTLDLLRLPPRAAILEPDGDLVWVEAEVVGDPCILLRVQLVVCVEAPLHPQLPLLLPEPPVAATPGLVIVIIFNLLLVHHSDSVHVRPRTPSLGSRRPPH